MIMSLSSSNGPLDLICLCCCSGALLSHVQLVVHQDPKVPSSRLLPSRTDPSLYWALWLCHPRCRTLQLSLLNFIQFLLAHSSSPSTYLCKMALPSDMSSSLPSLVSSADLVKGFSIPSSQLSMTSMPSVKSPMSIYW